MKLPKLKFPINRTIDIESSELRRATLIVFYPDVSDEAVKFEGKTEDVVLVAAVSHYKAAVWFPR